MAVAEETSGRPRAPVRPDRNLALELVRVTESAAMGAGRWVGRGDKIAADQAAVDAMRAMLDSVSMDGLVVIGEGEKDEAPMLFNGESIGDGTGPQVDVAVDPLEGTRLTALGQPNAIAAIAAGQSGTGVDMLYGIGGTPEGVISAAALKAVGGGMQGKLWPRNDEERQALVDSGNDLDRVLTTDDLVSGQDVFVAATGVTTGALLRGVRYLPNGAITDSIVMRSRSGTVRRIEASHALDKLESFTGREYSYY